jgi:hypothetical protein
MQIVRKIVTITFILFLIYFNTKAQAQTTWIIAKFSGYGLGGWYWVIEDNVGDAKDELKTEHVCVPVNTLGNRTSDFELFGTPVQNTFTGTLSVVISNKNIDVNQAVMCYPINVTQGGVQTKQLSDLGITDLSSSGINRLAGLQDGFICGNIDKVLAESSVLGGTLVARCIRDETSLVGNVRYGYGTAVGTTYFKKSQLSCNNQSLSLSGPDLCDNFIGCSNRNADFDNQITDTVDNVQKVRRMYCLNVGGQSKAVVCPQKITYRIEIPAERTVELNITRYYADLSINGIQSDFSGVCKKLSDYQNDKDLKENLDSTPGYIAGCSLNSDFEIERNKPDKTFCDGADDCSQRSIFSGGPSSGIYCIKNEGETSAKKYICLNSYLDSSNSTVNISGNYNNAKSAIAYSYLPSNLGSGETLSNLRPCLLLTDLPQDYDFTRNVVPIRPLSPNDILKRISEFLYGTSIFIFVMLMVINGINFVNAKNGGGPGDLKKAQQGLFNAIAGLLFIIFAGGFIINLINSIGI